MPEAFNPADGVAVAYEVHGDGTPALVFVHGWSCDRSYWREQLTAFSRSFKVVAMMLEDPEAFNALFEQAIGKILGRAQRGRSASVEALILDLLEWIGPKPRPYAEVIEAWRTSCPRLPVWEDANQRGYIDHRHEPGRGSWVAVSAAGREHLRRQRLPTQV